jgi:hypothetical protein
MAALITCAPAEAIGVRPGLLVNNGENAGPSNQRLWFELGSDAPGPSS